MTRPAERGWRLLDCDPGTGSLRFTDLDLAPRAPSRFHWAECFSGPTAAAGLPLNYIRERSELDDLATYFTWAAWTRVERLIRLAFWGLNVGLGLMIVLNLFPAGVLQSWVSIANGYWHARQPAFTMSGPFHALEWVRLAGDGVFLAAGVVPLVTATLMVVLDPAPYRSEERTRIA